MAAEAPPVTIFTQGPEVRRGKVLEEYEAPVSSMLGATAAEAWLYSPTSSLDRLGELRTAEEGRMEFEPDPEGRGFLGGRFRRRAPTEGRLSREQAEMRVAEAGVDLQVPILGIQESALDLLIERKRAERLRQDTIARSPSGFVPGLLRFGTALGVSMLDPLNVAAAFIPVVGPARYGRMLEQAGGAAGRAGVRARVGAVEGAAGMAAVEPLVYGAAQAEQADYTMADSILNLAMGTVLGGGLHVGAGVIGDAIRGGRPWQRAQPEGDAARRVAEWSPEQRVEALRVAVAQAAEGRPVDVERWVEVRDAIAEIRPATLDEARRQARTALEQDMRRTLTGELEAKIPHKELNALRAERAAAQRELEAVEGTFRERVKTLQRGGLSRERAELQARKDIAGRRGELDEQIRAMDERLRADTAARAAAKDIEAMDRGQTPERFRPQIEQEARRRFETGGLKPLTAAVREAMDTGAARRIDGAWQRLRDAEARRPAEESTVADPRAAAEAQERLAQAPKDEDADTVAAEAQEAMDSARDLAENLGRDPTTELAEIDRILTDAEAFGNAGRVAANCMFRRAR